MGYFYQAKPSQALTDPRRPQATPATKAFRFTPLLVALFLVYPALRIQSAQAEETPGSKNSLPDLGVAAPQSNANLSAGPSGARFENNFGRQKISVTPEYSNQTGLSIGTALASMLGDHAAVGVVLTAGADKREWLINVGYKLDERQRFIVTAGQLEQFLDYSFRSGTDKVGMTQNSGALSYQLQLGREFLRFLEINGYVAKTASRDLADKTFAVDSATLFELWNDPRRIAGGKVTGLQGQLGFAPLVGSTVKVSFGQERLSYDLLAGTDSVNRLTGGVEWQQQLSSGYQIKAAADTYAAQNRYTLGVERSLAGNDGRHNLGVSLVGLRGRDGLGDDNQLKLTYTYIFGASGGNNAGLALGAKAKAPDQTAAWSGSSLLDQVAMRPSFIPSQVVAKVDQTALPTRLIAVDKTALPAGSSVNTTTGDVTTPLGVVVTSIASVTKNLGAFANTGQFSLSGNSLVIKPSLIVQPAVGVTDSYVVTVNNFGGGTTLVTVLISHGSVKVDSIVVAAGGADVTPPVTTAGPTISVAATDTTASVTQTINEAGTGYYLVLPAAAAAPSVAAVKAGTSFAMAAATPAVVALTGLTPSTAYKYYFVAKDAANNDQAAVSAGLAITTTAAPDVTPPTTTVAPSVAGTTSTGTTLSVTINENGTGYYLVLPAAAAAPSVAAVQAGTSFAMTANVAATPAISGLVFSTAYKIYFVAKDAANNVQAAVQNASVTSATTTPTGLNFTGNILSWTAVAGAVSYNVENITTVDPAMYTGAATSIDALTAGANSGDTLSITAINASGTSSTAALIVMP